MAQTPILAHRGFIGGCYIVNNTNPLFCTDISMAVDSKPTFYDHSIGLEESPQSKHGTDIQKKYFRYTPAAPTLSISGPVHQATTSSKYLWETILFKEMLRKGTKHDMFVNYYRDNLGFAGHKLVNARLQTLAFDVRAGEVASFNAEFVGEDLLKDYSAPPAASIAKLVTWDKCGVGGRSTMLGAINGFTLSFHNPIIPIYTAKSFTTNPDFKLRPFALRIGMQEITGSLTVYKQNHFFKNASDTELLTFKIGDELPVIKLRVAFSPPPNKSSGSSLFMSTTNFTAYTDNPMPPDNFAS